VIATFHLLTGEYPPRAGGIGDYTALLAAALARRGAGVHVWTADGDASAASNGVQVHALPDRFGRAARRRLEQGLSAIPGCVVLQYVPNALGARGANLAFCFWLLRMRRRGIDVRVMFHEPYFYFSLAHPLGNLLAIAQRLMAALLLRASRIVYISTDAWIRYLAPYAPAGTSWNTLPIPSTIPAMPGGAAADRWSVRGLGARGRLIGHFGTFGADVARPLAGFMATSLAGDRDLHFLCLGRHSEAFAAAMTSEHPDLGDRIHASGWLPPADLAAALTACDLLIQPYPDGVTTRRTSVMAGLSNGVATLTTSGALTEDIWAATGAVALAPASDRIALIRRAASLLDDDGARRRLAANGRRVYEERFALEHSVRVVLEESRVKGEG
jgi:glycosyltransferase involved in cell wall biosynthesis